MTTAHLGLFLHELGILGSEMESYAVAKSIKKNWEGLTHYWMEHPELRLTQVLIGMGFIPNATGTWFYKDESLWLIEKGILEERDITFWGSQLDKDNKPLEQTKWRLIKNLTGKHLKAIKVFCEAKGRPVPRIITNEISYRNEH